MDDQLHALLDRALADIDTLVDGLLGGQLDPIAWHNQMVVLLGDYHSAAYLLGRDVDEMSPEARKELLKRVGQQVEYLNGFTSAIEQGAYQDRAEALRARAELYAGPLKATYSRAEFWDWPLPFHPTEGSECMVNCHCSWDLDVLDLEELDADAYWRMGATERHCTTCPARQANNPYQIRGGELI